MSHSEPARSPIRRTRSSLLAAVLSGATLLVAVGCQPTDPSLAPSPFGAASPPASTPLADRHGPPAQRARDDQHRTVAPAAPRPAALGEAGGALPDGATAFDGEYPGMANLAPDLLQALRAATVAARDDGVEVVVNSGWRSREYQDQLLREAVSDYGSEEKAAEWVATPDTSFHVSGDAVDVGRPARAWLSEHGAEYGLCQIYGNEPWHYELRPEAAREGCPAMYPDPTHDPRMQR